MSISSRAKYQADAPANSGEEPVAEENKMERNTRKNYHRKGKTPSGHSGKRHFRPDYVRGGKRH